MNKKKYEESDFGHFGFKKYKYYIRHTEEGIGWKGNYKGQYYLCILYQDRVDGYRGPEIEYGVMHLSSCFGLILGLEYPVKLRNVDTSTPFIPPEGSRLETYTTEWKEYLEQLKDNQLK